MSSLGAAVGGLEIGLRMTRQQAKSLRSRRDGDAKRGSGEDLAIRAVADSNSLRIHLGLIGDRSAMAGTVDFHEHPAVHLPPASNSIVLPESGICAGALTSLMKVSVLLPGRTLPPTVPTSFACEGITDAGFTSSLITYAASTGPVVNPSPMF